MDKVQIVIFAIRFVQILRSFIVYAIIARVLVSWFTFGQSQPRNQLTNFLYSATEPFLKLVRLIPHRIGMIDLSPIIALIGIDILAEFVVMLLGNLLR
ncbi:YggT family protein [Candidatus Peregrinibacteria bacterium]|nr:YggT family protein [Candidatus Peregrinibacteria bacterium]